MLIANITGKKSISICLLLLTGSRPALPFSFWHPTPTSSHLHSASSGSAVRRPPHSGQALPCVWGSMGSRRTCWKQREVHCWLQCQYGQATGTDLQVQCATFKIFLSKSSGVLLCHDICKPLRSRYLILLQWPNCPETVASQGSASQPGQRAGEGATQAALPAGTLCSPGVLPCLGAHPSWDVHAHRPSLSRHLGWHLTCGHSRTQGSLKESALGKMRTVVVCAFTPVFNKIRIAGPVGVCGHQEITEGLLSQY